MKYLRIVCLTALGLVVSYVFTCMLLNQEVRLPFDVFGLTHLELTHEEIAQSAQDMILQEDGSFVTDDSSYFVFQDLARRVGKISNFYFDIELLSDQSPQRPINMAVHYAAADGVFAAPRSLQLGLEEGGMMWVLEDYVEDYIESIDQFRLTPINYPNVVFRVNRIELNKGCAFSWLVFGAVFAAYCVILMNAWLNDKWRAVDTEMNKNGNKLQYQFNT